MHALIKVRVAWIVMMMFTTNKLMAGMELFIDGFRGLSITCNIAELFK